MIFEKDVISFHIQDVLALKQANASITNSGRNFSALSFRFRADGILATENAVYPITSYTVAYVPSCLNYSRRVTQDELIAVHFDTIDYQTNEIELFRTSNYERLGELFREMLACWEGKEIGYQLSCSAILYEIFAECYKENFKSEKSSSKIAASVEYMHENYTRSDLCIREIAEQSFISEVYFRKLFRQKYGTSPQKYIVKLRIQYAAGLIATGYYSLKEIAFMSGYTDYKYFSMEFKRIKGTSPSQYLYNFN